MLLAVASQWLTGHNHDLHSGSPYPPFSCSNMVTFVLKNKIATTMLPNSRLQNCNQQTDGWRHSGFTIKKWIQFLSGSTMLIPHWLWSPCLTFPTAQKASQHGSSSELSFGYFWIDAACRDILPMKRKTLSETPRPSPAYYSQAPVQK